MLVGEGLEVKCEVKGGKVSDTRTRDGSNAVTICRSSLAVICAYMPTGSQQILPLEFPDIPEGLPYQQSACVAYNLVKRAYERSVSSLFSDDNDPICSKIQYSDLMTRTIPLFIALTKCGAGVDNAWACVPLELLYSLALTLHAAMSQRYVHPSCWGIAAPHLISSFSFIVVR